MKATMKLMCEHSTFLSENHKPVAGGGKGRVTTWARHEQNAYRRRRTSLLHPRSVVTTVEMVHPEQ